MGFPCGSVTKKSACNAGDPGSIPGSERSPGEWNATYSSIPLENPMDRRAWWATVHGTAKNWTQLSDCHITSLLTIVQNNKDAFRKYDTSFPDNSADKEPTCNAGDPSSIPGLGRSPGEGNGYPLQYSGLENAMDYTVHGVTKSRTRLSNFHT